MTQAFGKQWKAFFEELEVSYGLDPSLDAHIWLLHHLFTQMLNEHATAFQNAWNHHVMELEGQRNRSPMDMWWFGQMERGMRGLDIFSAPEDDDMELRDIANYGVDWEAIRNPEIMAHFHEHNPQENGDAQHSNPFHAAFRGGITHVEVPNARCPFGPDEVAYLDRCLSNIPRSYKSPKAVQIHLWRTGLLISSQIFEHGIPLFGPFS